MHPACQKCTSDLRGGAIEYAVKQLVRRRDIPTYPSAPDLHDDFPRLEVIALDDLLCAGRSTVKPEVMLRVSEDANVGFELRRCSRHGQGGGRVDLGGYWDGGVVRLYSHLPRGAPEPLSCAWGHDQCLTVGSVANFK